ncbi:unnamed protein product [Didymodactylos carnosus]|uniref:Nicotinamide mononucleotide transporter n=1 Tax=Didymodactylos carnosus TaxID=1234261 RepID=A0A8S2I0C5_9BILA|nr:unnamed protein product [Didymodactylos carnosus]CAF3679325.1 unnamed protein product [Didymodactylos carnosus]
MSTVTLELTDTSGANSGSTIDTSHESSLVIIDSDEEDTDKNDKRVKPNNVTVSNGFLLLSTTTTSLRTPNRQTSFCHKYWLINKLIIKSIIPDIKSFKLWQIILLLLFAVINVTFSILDFNSFFEQHKQRSIFKWSNDLSDGISLWKRILLCFSGIASFTNVVSVVLVIKGKLSSYLWGIIAAILYGIYSFAYGYVGDAQLYVMFFLPMQFVGVYMWSKELDSSSTTRVKSLSRFSWLVVLVISIGLGVIFYYEIPAFSKLLVGSYSFEAKLIPHVLDATTNALSVVAQFLLILCYWEQYVYWLVVNTMAIVMYSGLIETKLDINLLLVWIMLAINSLFGLYTWFMRWRRQSRPCVYATVFR